MLELTLKDMSCGHCAKVVTETVHALDADATVEIDLPSHAVRVDSGADPVAIKQALAAAGYPAN